MNDLERDLHDLLQAKARDASTTSEPDAQVLKRARRRQVGTVVTMLLVVATLVVGSMAALDVLRGVDQTPPRPATEPVLPEAPPGFESAALPYASIAYPRDWYLLDTSPLVPPGVEQPEVVSGPILQLANFDPDLPHSPRCMVDPDALPSEGVLLTVGIMTPDEAAIAGEPSGAWPVELTPLPSNADPVCTGGPRPRVATWTAASGVIYWANAAHGTDASEADVRAMELAFESLAFPATDQPQMSRMAAFQRQGTPRVVLGDERVGSDIATIVAFVEFNKSLTVGVSASDGLGSCCSGVPTPPDTGHQGEPVHSSNMVTDGGTLVYGVISPHVVRAEIRTSEDQSIPVSSASLPPSMGYDARVVWGLVPRADPFATIVGFDAEGNLLGDLPTPPGPRTTIATGHDPEGGRWELYLEGSPDGTGLGFEWETGSGGGGCCLTPLDAALELDGVGWGAGEPGHITALASDDVAGLVFEGSDGTTIEGNVYPVPDESIGIPQVGLVIVPEAAALEGDLVAYDAEGNEVDREFVEVVGNAPEPKGPTAEIDVVWTRLRRARDTVTEYAARHDASLSGFDASAAARIDPGVGGDPGIRWNDGPLQGGSVTVRGVARAGGSELTGLSGWNAVLVSATTGPDGTVGSIYCIAVNIDENGGVNLRYGVQDAASYEECRGGWPELE